MMLKNQLRALGATLFPLTSFVLSAQDFLEADPYYDQSNVPVNVYKAKSPFIGKVVSTKRVVGPMATSETCHIIIEHDGDFPYWEGQSWGVIPPGTDELGRPYAPRLYSLASSRYGDDMTGKTGSLCVERAEYWDSDAQAVDPAKDGVASNFLCDSEPGDEVMLTGPHGKMMLLPEENPSADYIMIGADTGVAPFRGYIRRLFFEDTPAAESYNGTAWLMLEVDNDDSLLYDDEFQWAVSEFDNFRLDYALRDETTYIQDILEENSDEIFSRLETGAHIFISGPMEVMPGIEDKFKELCERNGVNYNHWINGLRANKQWHGVLY